MKRVLLALLVLSSFAHARVEFSAELLYLKPQVSGLSYGLLVKGGFPLTASTSSSGEFAFCSSVQDPKFCYDAGYRLKLGYQCPCTPYTCSIIGTRFCSEAKGCVKLEDDKKYFLGTWSSPSVSILAPFIDLNSFDPPIDGRVAHRFQKAKADYDLGIGLIDFQGSVCLAPSPCFSFQPKLAIRVGWIDQKYKLSNTFDGEIEGVIVVTTFPYTEAFGEYEEEIRFKNDFFGVGLLGGFDFAYQLGCGCCVYAKFAGSLLKGRLELVETYEMEGSFRPESLTRKDLFEKEIAYKQKDCFHLTRPIVDMEIGVCTTVCLCCIPVCVQLGWEQHSYFGQVGIWQFAQLFCEKNQDFSSCDRGDITVQGWKLSMGLEY